MINYAVVVRTTFGSDYPEELRADLLCVIKRGTMLQCFFKTGLEEGSYLTDDVSKYTFPLMITAETPIGNVSLEFVNDSVFRLVPINPPWTDNQELVNLNPYVRLTLELLRDFAIFKVITIPWPSDTVIHWDENMALNPN